MKLDKNLLFAILSMDAYNQGYGRGVPHDAIQIGDATKGVDSSQLLRDQNNEPRDAPAGFYATTYRIDGSRFDGLGANDIVISFRGTDNFVPLTSGSDVGSGWVTGAGILGNQARLAAEFYHIVRAANPTDNIILTGHSLGGGLAGMLANMFGHEAVIFDNMPFELASQRAHDIASRRDESIDEEANLLEDPTLREMFREQLILERQDIRDAFYDGSAPPPSTNKDKISAFAMPGEVLTAVRGLQSTDVEPVGTTSASQNLFDVPSAALIDKPVQLHWIDPLIIKLFSDLIEPEKAFSGRWEEELHQEVLRALYSDDVARAIDPENSYRETMAHIAYSALEGEGSVFGDTGIRALFDDLDQLAKIVGGESPNSFLNEELSGNWFFDRLTVLDSLASAVVQYAGALAHNKVVKPDEGNEGINPTQGVIEVSSDDTTFALDLSNVLWRDVLKTGNPNAPDEFEVVNADELLAGYLKSAPANQGCGTKIELLHELFAEAQG